MSTILFVDDEADLREAARQTLMLADLEAQTQAEPETALAMLGRQFDGILVTDIRMPGMDGLTLMARALEIDPELPVILVTGHGDVELAVGAMRDGAYDFLEKPYAPARLVDAVRRALDKRRLTLENRALRRQVGRRDAIEVRLTGRSAAITTLRQELRAVAATEADVLILGETGSGKEVAARALHRGSARADGPFVHINCAALPADLIESELFGHEAGAFPGAARARVGKFEHARSGIVFLDEIDSLPLALQGKLLHVIESRMITRLGSNDPIHLGIRIVAAAKSDLVAAAETGAFRADLLYRLNVVTLHVPALADRREDIPALFAQLVHEAAARYKRAVPDLPGAMLMRLAAKDWPGNVRELRNLAERHVLGLELGLGGTLGETSGGGLGEAMAEREKALIAATLAAQGGSLKATYQALQISRKALYDKMQRHGLARHSFTED
ncbi:MAG: sigma-54 dependent transcriptional regulator [Pseudomonadota bacterium]